MDSTRPRGGATAGRDTDMTKTGKLRLAVAGLVTMGGAAVAAGPLAALADVEPGRWELRDRDGKGVRTVCIAQPTDLFQVRHVSGACQHRVVESTARSATVTYTCQGTGKGRTALTVETGRLVQIDTQGVSQGMPFASAYEARRVGDCAASADAGRRRRAG